MIKWPDMVFPAINLWNCPRQDELEEINRLRGISARHRDIAKMQSEMHDMHKEASIGELGLMLMNNMHAAHVERMIKEREFLYYLRSGRFPE
jgi:hypothetical protein